MAGKKKTAKQKALPGLERKQNRKVEAKGRALRAVHKKWKELGRERKKALDALIDTMRTEEVPVYVDDEAVPPFKIDLTQKFEVKISEWKEPPEDKEEDDEPEEPPPAPPEVH
jgi:hypothetical protein